MLSEARHSQSINRLAAALALVLGLAVAGGCASGGDEGATASASAAGSGSGSESGEAYPNLGDVPDRPETMTEEQRRQLEQGLVADSQQRAYSEDAIAFQADPAEPLPAPMETGAGGAAGQSLGDVTMPGAVAPPFSGAPSTPSAAPEAPSGASAAPAAASGASAAPAAASGASAAATERAAAAAQATPPNIPVPPEDPMARATTPPFSGATAPPVPQAPAPPVAQTIAPYTPPPPASVTPPAASVPPAASYTPVPSASPALAGDASTSNLNRAQLDSLQPSTPPFSGATGAAPGSYAPTPLTAGAAAGASAPKPVASAYVPTPATPAYTPTPATPAYTPPPAASAYPPPPVAPASAPPEGVQQVYEARLQDTLPEAPMASLPSDGDLEGGEPLATVVVSSTGVATFEELPVNVPVLEREPVPAAAPGGQRASLKREAVPSSSVKVATILFSDGSSDLRDREREIVREVYERYLSSGRKVRVVGHSSSRTRNMDPVRHRMVNFGISAERANAVAEELQRLGVPSDQITVVAASDDMPVYYEVMPSGEAGNRRTEIYLD